MKQVLLVISLVIASASVAGESARQGDVRINADDFRTRNLGYELDDKQKLLVVEAVPQRDETKALLGYSRVRAWYDTRKMVYRKASFWNDEDIKTRTLHFAELQYKAGRYIPTLIKIEDHLSGATTILETGRKAQRADTRHKPGQTPLLFPGFYPEFYQDTTGFD